MTTAQAEKFGKRLLVNVVDERAENEPDREWVSIPRSSDPKDGWKKITYQQAANAVNRVAHKLVKSTGVPNQGDFPTVAYIGPSDVRYLVFALGAVKAGYKALFISPRNSQEGQLNLFEQTNCQVIWFEATYKNLVQSWVQERDMHAFMAFPVEAWFPEQHIEPYPYNKTFDEAAWDPLLVLHTSGSTGFPKPVVVRHGMLAIADKYHNHGEWNGKRFWLDEMARRSTRMLLPSKWQYRWATVRTQLTGVLVVPLYHAAALYLALLMIHYWDLPAAFGVGDRPLSADLALDCLKHAAVDSVLLPPAILEELSQGEESVDVLKKLAYVGFGGGEQSFRKGFQWGFGTRMSC